jgi:hypothetical protein
LKIKKEHGTLEARITLAMEAIKNLKMVEAARTEAQNVIGTDPNFSKYPLLKERAERTETKIHLAQGGFWFLKPYA